MSQNAQKPSKRPRGLIETTFRLGMVTALSRVLGLFRDVLLTFSLGAGPAGDIFVVALRLPAMVRQLSAEGALSAAFVPIYANLSEKNAAQAQQFRLAVTRRLVLVLGLLILGIVVFTPVLLGLWVGRLLETPSGAFLSFTAVRLGFPFILFASLAALWTAVFNVAGFWVMPALFGLCFNLFLIFSLLLLPSGGEYNVLFLSGTITLSGLAQSILLYIYGIKKGVFRPPPPSVARAEGEPLRSLLKLFFRRFIPTALGAGLYQLNGLVDTFFTARLAAGSLAHLYYADRLYQLPLGILGASAGVSLLPVISRAVGAGRPQEAAAAQNNLLAFILFLGLPAAVGLMVCGDVFTDVLFRHGAYSLEDTRATAVGLLAFGTGLPAALITKMVNAPFFARGDMRTPLLFLGMAVVGNAVLDSLLAGPWGLFGIAFSTALMAWLYVGGLFWRLRRGGLWVADALFWRRLQRILLGTAVMGLVLVALRFLWPYDPAAGRGIRFAYVFVMTAGGALAYGALQFLWLRPYRLAELKDRFFH